MVWIKHIGKLLPLEGGIYYSKIIIVYTRAHIMEDGNKQDNELDRNSSDGTQCYNLHTYSFASNPFERASGEIYGSEHSTLLNETSQEYCIVPSQVNKVEENLGYSMEKIAQTNSFEEKTCQSFINLQNGIYVKPPVHLTEVKNEFPHYTEDVTHVRQQCDPSVGQMNNQNEMNGIQMMEEAKPNISNIAGIESSANGSQFHTTDQRGIFTVQNPMPISQPTVDVEQFLITQMKTRIIIDKRPNHALPNDASQLATGSGINQTGGGIHLGPLTQMHGPYGNIISQQKWDMPVNTHGNFHITTRDDVNSGSLPAIHLATAIPNQADNVKVKPELTTIAENYAPFYSSTANDGLSQQHEIIPSTNMDYRNTQQAFIYQALPIHQQVLSANTSSTDQYNRFGFQPADMLKSPNAIYSAPITPYSGVQHHNSYEFAMSTAQTTQHVGLPHDATGFRKCHSDLQANYAFVPESQSTLNHQAFHQQHLVGYQNVPSSHNTVTAVESTPPSNIQDMTKKRRKPAASNHEKRPFTCTYKNCGKRYFKQSNLIMHTKKHAGERPHACSYPGCGRKFQRSDQLKRHYRKHTGEKPYGCEICGRKFARSDHLKTHNQSHLAKPYMCQICKKKFARPEDLQTHHTSHKTYNGGMVKIDTGTWNPTKPIQSINYMQDSFPSTQTV